MCIQLTDYFSYFRLPSCKLKTQKLVHNRHQETMLKVISLLKSYGANFLDLSNEYLSLMKKRRIISTAIYTQVEQKRLQLILQRDLVLHGADNIIRCQLKCMSENFKIHSTSLANEDIFKVIRTYNLALERLRRCFIFDATDEEDLNENLNEIVPSTSNLSVPNPKKKQPDPPPPPIDKIKSFLVPESLISPTATLKKFTASHILKVVGSVRTADVTEFITEALLSRIEVPPENGNSKINFPWKPVSFGINSKSYPDMDIFEEALAKEEDENRLNQRKLDLALQQEFGEDFPGTDYLPASDCSHALKPLSSAKMDALIKTNSFFLDLLLKKFLNTSGVIG